MSPRRLIALTAFASVALLGMLSATIWYAQIPRFGASATSNPLTFRPNDADVLERFDTLEALRAGTLERATVTADGIQLSDQRKDAFPRRGFWTSDVRQTRFPFYELIPSYNANCPPDTGVRIHARVRFTDGTWSPWLYFGRWGRTIAADRQDRTPVTRFDRGRVAVDTLVLDRAADAYQLRLSLQSFATDTPATPLVRRVAAVYSGPVEDEGLRNSLLAASVPAGGRWDRSLPVPFVPQGDAPEAVIGEVCSPTSVTMVAAYAGKPRPLAQNAMAIYDEDTGIFGNWNRAVQRAGELGLDAWITRYRNWEQVKAQIASGQPVIASIKFPKGVMPNNPIYQDTDGHLIVIRGFTASGDVIVNDPASREKGNGVVYRAEELAKAWFGAGGVAYIIRPASSRSVTSSATTQPVRF
jgi:hypothetical protein